MHDNLRAQIQELLVRLADGDRSAFDLLFARIWPLLFKFTARLLRDGADAEDAAQQAMLKVFWRVSEFDRQRDGLSWIFGVAANECRTLRRRMQRRRESSLSVQEMAGRWVADVDVEEDALRQELVAAAEAVLANLPANDIDVIRTSLQGTARPIGVTAATFRKRLERAFHRLRLAWGTKYGSQL